MASHYTLILLLFFFTATSAQSAEKLPSADNVKFIIVGFRHGNRNPSQFLKNDTTHDEWAWEGASQLTNIGKRQAYSLGQFLRERYGHLIPDEFFPSQVKAFSSSAERCQQTLQTCLAGLYPPKGRAVWNPSLSWQPIPYEINDPLLRMYNVKCPHYKEVYQGISDDTDKAANEWLQRDPELVDYISKNSGLNASLSDLADVADNIGNMELFNATLPIWVTKPTLKGYTEEKMFEAVTSFREAHQILCANDSECARMMAGLWLDQIVQVLHSLDHSELKDRKAHLYAAHTETVLSLIRLLKAEDVSETPTSAGFIIEYKFTPTSGSQVRFIFHEPDPNNPDRRLAEVKKLSGCEGAEEAAVDNWCPTGHFVTAVKGPSFSDWKEACKLPQCPV